MRRIEGDQGQTFTSMLNLFSFLVNNFHGIFVTFSRKENNVKWITLGELRYAPPRVARRDRRRVGCRCLITLILYEEGRVNIQFGYTHIPVIVWYYMRVWVWGIKNEGEGKCKEKRQKGLSGEPYALILRCSPSGIGTTQETWYLSESWTTRSQLHAWIFFTDSMYLIYVSIYYIRVNDVNK